MGHLLISVITWIYKMCAILLFIRKEGMFYLTLHSTHISQKGNPPPPHDLLFSISSKSSTDRRAHTSRGEIVHLLYIDRHVLVSRIARFSDMFCRSLSVPANNTISSACITILTSSCSNSNPIIRNLD